MDIARKRSGPKNEEYEGLKETRLQTKRYNCPSSHDLATWPKVWTIMINGAKAQINKPVPKMKSSKNQKGKSKHS